MFSLVLIADNYLARVMLLSFFHHPLYLRCNLGIYGFCFLNFPPFGKCWRLSIFIYSFVPQYFILFYSCTLLSCPTDTRITSIGKVQFRFLIAPLYYQFEHCDTVLIVLSGLWPTSPMCTPAMSLFCQFAERCSAEHISERPTFFIFDFKLCQSVSHSI